MKQNSIVMFNEKFCCLLHVAEAAADVQEFEFSDDDGEYNRRWEEWWSSVKELKTIIGWMIPLDVSRAAKKNLAYNNDRPDFLWLVEFLKHEDDRDIVYA